MTTWYCPLPFKHAFIDSTGVGACCQTPRYPVSVSQWIEHPELKKLQQAFLSGKQPQQCQACVTSEQQQGRSLRTDATNDYNNEIFETANIDFVDFRSYNICNFKCRSCSPHFSHRIFQEANKHTELKQFLGRDVSTKTVSVSDDNVDWIIDNLGNLKRIMFTGGEPTLIPGVQDLITKIKNDHKEIMIMITSNASFEDDFWFEITRQLPNLHWTVSVDAVGGPAEIVRHGTNWSTVEKNVTWLSKNSPSLDINSVVSNLNVFCLKPLLEFGRRMQKISMTPTGRHGDLGCRHQFFICQRPYYLAADNWPEHLKTQVLSYLELCLTLNLDSEQENMVSGLLAQIQTNVFDHDLWNKTQSYNAILNRIRNENHLALYHPQL